MIKHIPLFKVGDIDYSDMGLDKRVHYSRENLEKIASHTNCVDLTKEHTNEVIGELKNFSIKDDTLMVEEPYDVDIKGYGISPTFVFDLIDMGDYYEPYDIILKSAGLTKKPRSNIYYNSISSTEDDKVSDDKTLQLMEQIQKNDEEIRKQREEIGVLRNQKKSLEASLKKKNDLETELNNLREENKKLSKDNEALTSKAKQYDEIETKERSELITKLANEDAEFQKELENLPIQTLRVLESKKNVTIPPSGVGEVGAPGLDDGTKLKDDGDDKPATYEDYQAWKKENGVR